MEQFEKTSNKLILKFLEHGPVGLLALIGAIALWGILTCYDSAQSFDDNLLPVGSVLLIFLLTYITILYLILKRSSSSEHKPLLPDSTVKKEDRNASGAAKKER